MHSREERKRAVELWLKYDKCSTAVSKELGYPCPKLFKSWYQDFIKEKETSIIHDRRRRASKYSDEQKSLAVQHYLDHGRCIARTVRALGYPCKDLLSEWCKEFAPERRKHSKGAVQFSKEQKKEAASPSVAGKAEPRTLLTHTAQQEQRFTSGKMICSARRPP